LWQRVISRLRSRRALTRTTDETCPVPDDDELGRLIRWSLESTVGREGPPAAVWWRIRDEILGASRPLSRRWLRRVGRGVSLSWVVQGVATVALLLFMLTSVLGQPLTPWSLRTSAVTPTPKRLTELHASAEAPEGLLSGAHNFKPQQVRDRSEHGRSVERVGNLDTVRLSRVRDVAAFGFVPVTGRSRRVLTNPAEDVLISQVSKDFLAEIHARGQSVTDETPSPQVRGFRFGVIPIAYQLD